MDCAAFEAKLVRVMEAELRPGERESDLAELRRHAVDCPQCVGSTDLLDLLELAPAERDLVEPPGAGYWADFERRLRRRIETEPRAGRAAHLLWAGAAAVLLLATAVWLAGGPRDPIDAAEAGAHANEPLPAALAEALEQAASPGPLEPLEFLDGIPGGWEALPAAGSLGEEGDSWLFPGVYDLSPEERRELLEWLHRQTDAPMGATS